MRDPGRPVLDRIPGWKRTRLAVTGGDSADSVGVRLSGVDLLALGKAEARLNRRRPLAKPRHADTRGSARRRHLTVICGAGGGQGAEGRASIQRRSSNSGARECHRDEGLVAIHSAHPLPSRRRKATEEHRKKPKDPGRGGQLLFWPTSVAPGAGPLLRPGGRARSCGRAQGPPRLRSRCGPGPPARRTPPGHPLR